MMYSRHRLIRPPRASHLWSYKAVGFIIRGNFMSCYLIKCPEKIGLIKRWVLLTGVLLTDVYCSNGGLN